MISYDLDKMLYTIPADKHSTEEIREILGKHPEIKFVSLVGIDVGGHDTDEKIPVEEFLKDMDKFLTHGVQTDGSSVVLPKIAKLNNAKVDIIPDKTVNWFVDHNFNYPDPDTGLPVGTLRIPSSLVHNDSERVGSRVILRDAIRNFKDDLMELLKNNPYVFEYIDADSVDDIDKIIITAATELEFWVKTPDDDADREQLSTAQMLKEQYWKRTTGPVRTALEETMLILQKYGFEMEMGHKEVGGVKAKLGNSGVYDHVMEQLEIDWKYSSAVQAADNENQIKYVVRDIFRMYGLEVTFMAKPMEGVAGNGEHTHMGVSARLKNGKMINLFAPSDTENQFMSPIGFGALMGMLKNYDVINPFVSSSIDSLNRLKPGYEAPVCTVTSLGHSAQMPSRNRTVLVGLVRKTELRDLVQISVLGGVRDAVAANGRHLLLLVVAELEAELVELLHDDARIDRLLLRRLRHGSAERLSHVLVRPQVGQPHLRIHARVILHVVEHVARVFVGSYCIAVYGQHGLRAFVQRLIVDHHARHAADGRAQYNGGHGNHCSKTLY